MRISLYVKFYCSTLLSTEWKRRCEWHAGKCKFDYRSSSGESAATWFIKGKIWGQGLAGHCCTASAGVIAPENCRAQQAFTIRHANMPMDLWYRSIGSQVFYEQCGASFECISERPKPAMKQNNYESTGSHWQWLHCQDQGQAENKCCCSCHCPSTTRREKQVRFFCQSLPWPKQKSKCE